MYFTERYINVYITRNCPWGCPAQKHWFLCKLILLLQRSIIIHVFTLKTVKTNQMKSKSCLYLFKELWMMCDPASLNSSMLNSWVGNPATFWISDKNWYMLQFSPWASNSFSCMLLYQFKKWIDLTLKVSFHPASILKSMRQPWFKDSLETVLSKMGSRRSFLFPVVF